MAYGISGIGEIAAGIMAASKHCIARHQQRQRSIAASTNLAAIM